MDRLRDQLTQLLSQNKAIREELSLLKQQLLKANKKNSVIDLEKEKITQTFYQVQKGAETQKHQNLSTRHPGRQTETPDMSNANGMSTHTLSGIGNIMAHEMLGQSRSSSLDNNLQFKNTGKIMMPYNTSVSASVSTNNPKSNYAQQNRENMLSTGQFIVNDKSNKYNSLNSNKFVNGGNAAN